MPGYKKFGPTWNTWREAYATFKTVSLTLQIIYNGNINLFYTAPYMYSNVAFGSKEEKKP